MKSVAVGVGFLVSLLWSGYAMAQGCNGLAYHTETLMVCTTPEAMERVANGRFGRTEAVACKRITQKNVILMDQMDMNGGIPLPSGRFVIRGRICKTSECASCNSVYFVADMSY